jgi:hypothetical protein
METAEMANKGFGDQTKLYQKRAQAALPLLVRQAKAGQTMYYSELAAELDMPNPRNLNFPLGAVGREMEKLSRRLGTRIPPIQCLVINKQDGIPGEGIGWFVGDVNKFKKSSPTEKRRVIDSMLFEIFQFPDWDMVLAECGLEPVVVSSEASLTQESVAAVSRYGRGGEGDLHRGLKEFVACHPQLFDLPEGLVGEIEHPFPSADCLDVLFKNGSEWVGVEVKGPTSDDLDINRGLFQCVKYQSLMEAEQKLLQKGLNCRMVLAISRSLSPALSKKRIVLNIHTSIVLKPKAVRSS